MTDQHQGLPVAGYRPQNDANVALVNEHKAMEERLLRQLDRLQGTGHDDRWLAIARTHIQEGFMALNRAVFRPGRVSLPEDAARP
ncbi:Acb2/Tad1 domain-containing protein [Methylobacterium sp. ID0610]|uniref:Acb2/Tad1 domain-containing protein n=1 Tax=Methylobacterium carpenticola TaxID=3344827 RepID=UPI00368E7A1A